MSSVKLGMMMGFLVAASLALAACGGDSEPQSLTFTIEIRQGQPVGGAVTLQATQGDQVTINISSDTAGEVHLHGYDLEEELEPGETRTIAFTANATGRFLIELEETDAQLAFLEVRPR